MKSKKSKIMLSCKKASELIEKKKITSLGIYESIRLKFHIKMCQTCQTYENQSNFLDEALKIHYKNSKIETQKFSNEAKDILLHKLSQQSKGNQ